MTEINKLSARLEALRAWWLGVGALLFYLALSFFCLSQQWPVKLPNAIVEKGDATPQGAALYGLVACIPLFLGELALSWRYRVVSNARRWRRLLPHPPLLDPMKDDRTAEWAWAQLGLAFAFHILPAIGLVYFLARFLTGTAVVARLPVRGWGHLWPPVGWAAGLGKYDPSSDGKIAPDYLRFWEPWLLCLGTAACLLLLSRHLFLVFRSRR